MWTGQGTETSLDNPCLSYRCFLQVYSDVSVFEYNIRFVGGLLSAYALSKNEVSWLPGSQTPGVLQMV